MEFWKSKAFKLLSFEWDKRLETSGFTDIEKNGALKQRASNSYRQATQLERDTRLDYYLLLGHAYHNTIFPNSLEKTVMYRHSQGVPMIEIAKEVGKDKRTIRFIIRRWQMVWGIRTWSLKQRWLKKKPDIR